MGSRNGLRRSLTSVAGSALLACAARASGAGAFLSPSTADRLSPGTNILVSWTIGERPSADIDEMELVLSFDDGATFPVRVTGPVDVETHTTLVRVPALPSEHVRIAVRAGDDEDAASEEILFVSEPFAIESPTGLTLDTLFPVGNEWRTSDALEGSPVRSPAGALQVAEPTERLTLWGDDSAALETGPSICPIPTRETTPSRGGQKPPPGRLVDVPPAGRSVVPLRL